MKMHIPHIPAASSSQNGKIRGKIILQPRAMDGNRSDRSHDELCESVWSLVSARPCPSRTLPSPPPPPFRAQAPRPSLMVWDNAIGRQKGEKQAPQEYDDVSDNAVFTELTREDSGK